MEIISPFTTPFQGCLRDTGKYTMTKQINEWHAAYKTI